MQRRVLADSRVHPSILEKLAAPKADSVAEVEALVAQHPVVVVGMSQNPFPGRARKLLDEQRIPYHYVGYGSYLSQWRKRLPLKLWTGWPTFPMIFVNGTFIGGFDDMKRLLDSGEFQALLAAPRA
ncbi:MAG: glutaredoxin domain-containing protein [Polyangiaceae bacterium]